MSLYSEIDIAMMERAIRNADGARLVTSPNPWVGSVVVSRDGRIFDGATLPQGGEHAEVISLTAAADESEGSTLYTTLEPCSHVGNTPPCVESIVNAGVTRVVVGILDPDERVNGQGISALRSKGLDVEVGVMGEEIEAQLQPYLHHRLTGRPYVVAKIATTLDGRIAAPDRSSQWITGPEARMESHKIRAYSDAICVGAGTVRKDDPNLTVRDWQPPTGDGFDLNPVRVALGEIPPNASMHPCLELKGDIEGILDELGSRGILQLLVEGGADTISRFHTSGLINRYEIFFAPALFGTDEALPMLTGAGISTMSDLWRGEIIKVSKLGSDVQITLVPKFIDK